jgi:hypothetical protein
MSDFVQGIVAGAILFGFPVGLALGHHWFCEACRGSRHDRP